MRCFLDYNFLCWVITEKLLPAEHFEKFSSCYGHRADHYPAHKRPPVDSILRHVTQVRPTSHIPFILYSYSFNVLSYFSYACYILRSSHLFRFDHHNFIWWRVYRTAGYGGRAVWGMNCLPSRGHRDHGFESQSGHGCLVFVLCVVCAFFCVCVQVERPCDELINRPRSPIDCPRSSNWSETESFMEAAKSWIGLLSQRK
jgi:hypothetical protein